MYRASSRTSTLHSLPGLRDGESAASMDRDETGAAGAHIAQTSQTAGYVVPLCSAFLSTQTQRIEF